MTVSSSITTHSYIPAGAMLAESLAGLVFINASDLVVTDAAAAVQVLGTDYEITGNGRTGAASIRTLRVYGAGIALTVTRVTESAQLANIQPNQPLPAEAIETELDRRALIEQEGRREVAVLDLRALKVPKGEVAGPLPSKAAFAGKFLAGDALGNPIASSGTGADAGLRTDLAGPGGGDIVAVQRVAPGAPIRTIAAKAKDHFNLRDYATPGADASQALQYAVNEASVLTIPSTGTTWGISWAALNADILIPANRKIIVAPGALIENTGGRFTAHNVENVEWQIDGWVKSIAMRTAANRPLVEGTADNERGFFEFSQDYVAASAASGFDMHGSGKVSGDFVGSPNVTDLANQVNRKGIACWNARDVNIRQLEVFGFHGEAVYAFFFDTASRNIIFDQLFVHDTRFNALNFNAGANGGNCKITRNTAIRAFAIEMSAGEASDNYVQYMDYCGIWTGSGAGYGPVKINRNTILDTTVLHGISASYSAGFPVTDVELNDNIIKNSGQYGMFINHIRELTASRNKISGSGFALGGYDIGINNTLRGSVDDNRFFSPGPFSAGRIAYDGNSFDVQESGNKYIPATGAALAYNSTKNVRQFSTARTLANGQEIILPTLAPGEIMHLKITSPAGIGFYTIVAASASPMPGNDAGYSVGGAGSVTVTAAVPANTHKIVNVSSGNGFAFIVEGTIA